MNKIIYGLIFSLFLGVTSVSAEITPESMVNIFQRLEGLEQKVRKLYGQNEVLTHQLNQLRRSQKEGFLTIDKRIDAQLKAKPVVQPSNPSSSAVDKKKEETVKIVDYSVVPSAEKKQETKPATPATKAKTTESAAKVTEPEKPAEKKAAEAAPKPQETTANEDKEENEASVANTQAETSSKPNTASAYQKETYQQAFNLMKTSSSAATKAFKDYIKLQPDSPLAANAQYWIGEIMYSHNNYKGAVKEFIKVLQQYKSSSKAPDAAIKLGYSFYALKNWPYARRTFEDVLKYFPKNQNAVNLATKRLEKMTAAGN